MIIRATFAWGAAVASLALLSACGGDASLDRAGQGRVAIVLSAGGSPAAAEADASAAKSSERGTCRPARELQAADVTFSSLLARTLDGRLVDVTIDLPVTVDLLSLGSGREATLPAGFLPPDTYDQLVVVMTRVEVTLLDGTRIAVTPPGGGWTVVVRVAEPFTVEAGATTTLTLAFRRDLSFACAFDRWEFHPRFDCDR